MKPLRQLRSRTVVLPTRDIDTDQIIPARFLTTTSREGLGKHLFADLRFAPDGQPRDEFPLNRPDTDGCEILVAGNNFGCGSSREHAPWALLDYGIRAVVSTEIADIFRNNSLKNGLVPVVVPPDAHDFLLANPGVEVSLDVERAELRIGDGAAVPFPIDAFARYCLIEGIDQLGFLQQQMDHIEHFEEQRPWTP
ncbi:MAG: 3-isopropylmalate dehydratase small subunit [Woeseiaceae bacterium]|nr:3-isopropylmalate dehydratase small subunit [Woeseiaceae bacterium]